MHAWDLRDEGADHIMGWMYDSGLNEMYIASTYHSGYFIHPHCPERRTYMTEGSVAYFQPDHKLYKTPMRPQVASFARTTNWLAMAGERLGKHPMPEVSLAIRAHKTQIGLLDSGTTRTRRC